MVHVSNLKSVCWLIFVSFWLVFGSFRLLLLLFYRTLRKELLNLLYREKGEEEIIMRKGWNSCCNES